MQQNLESCSSRSAAAFSGGLIDINQTSSVAQWIAVLGCSELQLRYAIAEVGPDANDVLNELGLASPQHTRLVL